jgi:hypothetical protein
MKQITKDTLLKQGDKTYKAVQIWSETNNVFLPIIVWIDSIPLINADDNYPEYVVEKLTTGKFMLWHINSPNDIDRKTQYGIVAHYGTDIKGAPKIKLEDEVEKLAKEITNKYVNEREKQTAYLEFIDGYKANQAKYTEDDVKKAINMARSFTRNSKDQPFREVWDSEGIIQFLNSTRLIEVDENFKVIN